MDISKLVEDGARAICRSGKFESGQGTCSLLCMEALGDVRKSGCSRSTRLHGSLARAVLAIALAAAAETAKQAQFTDDPKHDHWAQACEEVSDRLRTLATQLGAANG